ncbi:MAG: hypothetical protein WB992_02690 [Bryobacteraceae bacterium]
MTPTRSDVEYEVWTLPGTSFNITYPLGLLHEVDFLVNDGYRRIPHGGIEVGGLLIGQCDENSAHIEAFRTIECEHAAGPSFVLSERDLAGLRDQLDGLKDDPELGGMTAVGWFVAHTRSTLEMNDRESALFDRLFPGPGKITLLIKPERFQPTRFGFLARGADGHVQRDATQQAIVLPLSGRARRAVEPIPEPLAEAIPMPAVGPPEEAIPEPLPQPSADPIAAPAAEVIAEAVAEPVEEPVAEMAPQLFPEPEPIAEVSEAAPEAVPQPVAEPAPEPVAEPMPEPAAKIEETAELIPQAPPAVPEIGSEPLEKPLREPENRLTRVPRPSSLPSIEEIRRRRSLQSAPAFDARSTHQQITRKLRQQGSRSKTRLGIVLFLAAALGCAVGYWGYLQLPSAVIPLSIRSEPSSLLVSWPPDQTRDAVSAAIRVDDGDPVPLSPEDKSAGETEITAVSTNIKIELIAQHWMRDSRGIVRYVRATKTEPPAAPVIENAPEPNSRSRHSRKSRSRT